ncbi:MAG: methyltransferase domain-containing protein [Acidobacteriia bacterium]|nr:methyltransferase domain-containing protein [Terriglobia bacterium]
MRQVSETYHKRDLWAKENLNYAQPHFRLEKAARLINEIARGKQCDLLDVGCGPATLKRLLAGNIDYHGIDIAIHDPGPNVIQTDFVETPISFRDKRFDIIIAQGVFEYIGTVQDQKFSEIARLLKNDGTFILSYVNFNHIRRKIYELYNNVQSFDEFHKSLRRFFRVDRVLPTSHHWHHEEPFTERTKNLQMRINLTIPLFSRRFAIEYFFICSSKNR